MNGVGLIREAALLAAACHLAEPDDRVPSAQDGWQAQPEQRAALFARLVAHEEMADPVRLRLMEQLGLGEPEYWLVMLCAAVELHPEVAAAVSLLTEEARQQLPTPTVLARILRGIRNIPYQQALAAVLDGGRARTVGLVEVQEAPAGTPLSQQPIRMVAGELAAFIGTGAGQDESRDVAGLDAVVIPPQQLTGYPPGVVDQAGRLLERRDLVVLRGRSRRGCRQLACDLATGLGRPAALIEVVAEPEQPVRLPGAAQLARVRSHAGDALVVVDLHPLAAVRAGMLATLRHGARAAGGLVLLVDEGVDTADLPVVDAPAIDHPVAQRIWSGLLPEHEAILLAQRFRVGVEEAVSAVREALDLTGASAVSGTPGGAHAAGARAATTREPDPGPDPERLADRVRAQGARRMGRYVSVVTSRARLADLVVPPSLAVQLDEIVSWHRSSHRVRWEMDVGAADPIGTGLTCLFSGKSGTGKTFAARCLASELGLNLYRIDLSQVVSKYIGETEKALAQIFDEVEAGHGMLLFDEADALFGRRSDVKDAHDRYANIEVGYLLQRLESYDGIAVLTTNLQSNMDAAFVRRLRFILQFPAPDRDLRRRLWEQSLPAPQWREGDLRLDLLADRFQLTGGAIHNIGLGAAHLAAATPSGRITLTHLTRATQRELQKAGRPFDASAFRDLVEVAS